jgi:hypothetical protein
VAAFLNPRLGRCSQLGIIWYRVHSMLRVERARVRTPVRARCFIFCKSLDRPWTTSNLLYIVDRISFSAVKWPKPVSNYPPTVAPRLSTITATRLNPLCLSWHVTFWSLPFPYHIYPAYSRVNYELEEGLGSSSEKFAPFWTKKTPILRNFKLYITQNCNFFSNL